MVPVTFSKPERKQMSARKRVISQRSISLRMRVFVTGSPSSSYKMTRSLPLPVLTSLPSLTLDIGRWTLGTLDPSATAGGTDFIPQPDLGHWSLDLLDLLCDAQFISELVVNKVRDLSLLVSYKLTPAIEFFSQQLALRFLTRKQLVSLSSRVAN